MLPQCDLPGFTCKLEPASDDRRKRWRVSGSLPCPSTVARTTHTIRIAAESRTGNVPPLELSLEIQAVSPIRVTPRVLLLPEEGSEDVVLRVRAADTSLPFRFVGVFAGSGESRHAVKSESARVDDAEGSFELRLSTRELAEVLPAGKTSGIIEVDCRGERGGWSCREPVLLRRAVMPVSVPETKAKAVGTVSH